LSELSYGSKDKQKFNTFQQELKEIERKFWLEMPDFGRKMAFLGAIWEYLNPKLPNKCLIISEWLHYAPFFSPFYIYYFFPAHLIEKMEPILPLIDNQ